MYVCRWRSQRCQCSWPLSTRVPLAPALQLPKISNRPPTTEDQQQCKDRPGTRCSTRISTTTGSCSGPSHHQASTRKQPPGTLRSAPLMRFELFSIDTTDDMLRFPCWQQRSFAVVMRWWHLRGWSPKYSVQAPLPTTVYRQCGHLFDGI